MIFDCHSHIWDLDSHLSGEFVSDFTTVYKVDRAALRADPDDHYQATRAADKVVVVAFKSVALNVNVPNEYVARYARRDPDRLLPFCCVDPNDPGAARELKTCVRDLGMKGLKLGPIYQNFDPNSDAAYRVFEAAQEVNVPVLIHQGTTFVRNSPLRFSNPALLDQVATKFPDLRMVVAHLGHPWEDETAVLIRKQPNVYADVSGLAFRPARLYLKMLTCLEYGVMDKLVLGSDFPFGTTSGAIDAVRKVNAFASASGFPSIPSASLEGIISSNADRLFGK